MKHFNPEHFPLHGTRLIEASAGTGKTYNIANLYLRLILGHGFEALSIDQILVVTFTKAATEELRGRIRNKIEAALQAFRDPDTYTSDVNADAFIKAMLVHYRDARQLKEACRKLSRALVCMDEASIFTIHGFSVRAIQSFLFETGALAEVEISEAASLHRERVIADLWRQLQLSNDELMQDYFIASGFGSQFEFQRYFSAVPVESTVLPTIDSGLLQQGLRAVVHAIDEELQHLRQQILNERAILKQRWADFFAGQDDKAIKEALKPVIDIPSPDNPKPKTVTQYLLPHLRKWLETESLSTAVPGGVTGERIASLLASGNSDPLSLLVIDLVKHAAKGFDDVAWQRNRLLPVLVQWLQHQLNKVDVASMQLDEVIRMINQKLVSGNEASAALRRIITSTWPVCMVDEFQDTDPQQFRMFNLLYGMAQQGHKTGFFMIGDPKQSIYAFRGADIFSYLDVRGQVQQEQTESDHRIFSLDTNFRSKQRLVNATNRLFAEKALPVFFYDGIHYAQVQSCEVTHGMDKGELHTPGEDKPLVFIGYPESGDEGTRLGSNDLRYIYAQDAAQRINALLQGSVLCSKNSEKSLRGGDVAVLVKNGAEARYMRDALQVYGIGSVYQSQRDSVFQSSEIAQDIYHILCAFNEPANIKQLKSAIATPLYRGFSTDFSLLDAIKDEESSDAVWEKLVDTFNEYKACWQRFGILAALNLLLQRARLGEVMAKQANGDRLMTDFRHLGDLLQQQYLQCGSTEQLIDWYARQLQDDSDIEEDVKRIRLESDENLVKIVTIHVSKGLEYPVVFLPFFFLPWKIDMKKKLPLLHNPDNHYQAEMDFMRATHEVEQQLQQEQTAEDMRLLYVAVTRAIYRCYIGISASKNRYEKMFPLTAWARLLDLPDDKKALPDWLALQAALKQRLGDEDVAYREIGDTEERRLFGYASDVVQPLLTAPEMPALTPSPWLITSYSQLAHSAHEVRTEGKDDEIMATEPLDAEAISAEREWQQHIRFSLKGSANTGECLHGIYETLAREADYYWHTDNEPMPGLVEKQLSRYGLLPPIRDISNEGQVLRDEKVRAVADWLSLTLDTPLGGPDGVPSLKQLFQSKAVLPELRFDFALGNRGCASFADVVNPVLHDAGLAPIGLPSHDELQGIMNGAIDLVFVHDNKVYVLDYKSNTLGRSPAFYQQSFMTNCMHSSRYDLQYMIYSVAVHRYFRTRFARRYDYDKGELSFGGVYYLFIRGMGIKGYPDHGIWFTRPDQQHVQQLDAAFSGIQG